MQTLYNLDTTEYYLTPPPVDTTGLFELYATLPATYGVAKTLVAVRDTLKKIESIQNFILERGFVTIALVENGRHVLRTFPISESMEIVFPK